MSQQRGVGVEAASRAVEPGGRKRARLDFAVI
jgi:hypothetical protein